jgi:ribonuclease BN (tRNA processing enzyme)
VAGKVVAYTGDGEWTDDLAKIGRDADLLIAECYYYAKPVRWHLNYLVLAEHLRDVGARRVILTHMSQEMLAHAAEIPEECAHDGLVVEV